MRLSQLLLVVMVRPLVASTGLERTGHDFKPIMVSTAEKLDSVSLKVPQFSRKLSVKTDG